MTHTHLMIHTQLAQQLPTLGAPSLDGDAGLE